MRKKLIVYTDGACRGNPGPAGIGVVICDESGKVVKEYEEFIGNATNNIAEYRALIKALELASVFSITEVDCFSDSELMVRQLNGEYSVRNEKLGKLFLQVRQKEKRFEKVNYSYISREGEEHLKRADKLANLAIDEFKIMERKREKDGWNYFVKGKEFLSKYRDDLSHEHVKEIEMSFRKAIELNPKLWAPHYYLGSLFYLTERYPEAKIEFEKAREKNIEPKYEQPIGYFLGEIKRIESGYSFPKNLKEVMEMTSDPVLLNHALMEWFENTLRGLIQKVLEGKYKEDWWWEGIPGNAKAEYGIRSQKCLKEERNLPQLYFLDFDHYKKIIHKNKKFFNPIMQDLEEWGKRIEDLEFIRNSIMHCRGQYLAKETISRLKESCIELQKLMEKLMKKNEGD